MARDPYRAFGLCTTCHRKWSKTDHECGPAPDRRTCPCQGCDFLRVWEKRKRA